MAHPSDVPGIEAGAQPIAAADDSPALVARDAALSAAQAEPRPLRGSRTFWRLTSAILFLAAVHVAYERVGTSANADRITHMESFGDEAVAIGMTDEQPGFVLLARLPASQVSVDAAMRSNWLTGQQTLVNVHTPAEAMRIRLRQPQVIMVYEDGAVINVPVPWTGAEFGQLLHAADCSSNCAKHLHRCGQPLEDIAHTLASWPQERVPESLRKFVKHHKNDTAQVNASTRGSRHE